ncbi:hypothetical protein PC129_g14993 [Phytophthora cactorum]|uniref:Uncharacterized protein n=1 Tax=Phytophthora cactorum TaxID=29920 RepID=A0A329S1Z8_9STRA|nr:hypothetical protein Pcac1_g6762 [Phytophthora cactorum]KAG2797378.1 hypothetical protein PC111_g21319 [Phytophthora cactorum]KAG2809381.1 hypothetical protein PC112_g16525 [Phytophthora cactorum]KAG2850679.1 hypothetical protein PC113_g16577 [Phytophthora cactorum]KAG2891909.1 hypothetical protein PC114_g16805 [Phytophthora cactorum]
MKAIAQVWGWMESDCQAGVDKRAIVEEILTAEVVAALAASKAGKTGGLDRIGNDWCRDYAKDLVPILTRQYNLWFAAGVSPESF